MIDRPFENIPDQKLIQFASDLDITESHWTRMIEFAKTQDQHERPKEDKMGKAIDETWFAEYCALCNRRYEYKYSDDPSCRSDCPLGIMYGKCTLSNSSNRWRLVQLSESWDEWGIDGLKFLKQIEKVHEEVTKEILRRNLSLRNEEEEVIQ